MVTCAAWVGAGPSVPSTAVEVTPGGPRGVLFAGATSQGIVRSGAPPPSIGPAADSAAALTCPRWVGGAATTPARRLARVTAMGSASAGLTCMRRPPPANGRADQPEPALSAHPSTVCRLMAPWKGIRATALPVPELLPRVSANGQIVTLRHRLDRFAPRPGGAPSGPGGRTSVRHRASVCRPPTCHGPARFGGRRLPPHRCGSP